MAKGAQHRRLAMGELMISIITPKISDIRGDQP